MKEQLIVKGARQHNLKNIDILFHVSNRRDDAAWYHLFI